MRKKILVLASLLFVLGVLSVSGSAYAALNLGSNITKQAAERAGYNPNADETTLAETVGSIIKTVLSTVGVIFLALMVYAGFLWMTARGESEQVDKAQDIIRAAIIGLIITVASYSITAFIVPRMVEKAGGTRPAPAVPAAPPVPPAAP